MQHFWGRSCEYLFLSRLLEKITRAYIILRTDAWSRRTIITAVGPKFLLKFQLDVRLLQLRSTFLCDQLADTNVLICVHFDVLAGGEKVADLHPRVAVSWLHLRVLVKDCGLERRLILEGGMSELLRNALL